jgi:tetratricopeptide (TPR) repeat protein
MVLATIYKGDNEPDKAIEVLKRGTRAIEQKTVLYMMLGDLYTLKKDYTSALDIYHKAEEAKTGYIPAIFRHGVVLHAMGKKKEAVAQYMRVLRLSKNYVPALNNLAYIYAEGNSNLERSLRLATRAYVLAPEDGPVLDTLGFVLLKNGKTSEALNTLKKAVELIPDNPSVYYHLSLAYKEEGDEAEAIKNLQKALRMGDFHEKELARYLLSELKRGME